VDETAVIAHSLEDMKVVTSRFAKTAHVFGFCIKMHKIEIMYQSCAHATERFGNIQIEGRTLENVSRFTYLGSTIIHDGSLLIELQTTGCVKIQLHLGD